MSESKRSYSMDYIADKNVYKAVMFARKMRKQCHDTEKAILVASKFYNVGTSDVAHYMGQIGGRKKAHNNG